MLPGTQFPRHRLPVNVSRLPVHRFATVRGYLTQRLTQRSQDRGAPECDRNVVMRASGLYSCQRIGVQRIAAGLALGLCTCTSVSNSDGEPLRFRESRICPRVSFTWRVPFLTQ